MYIIRKKYDRSWTLYDPIDNPAHGIKIQHTDGSFYSGTSTDSDVINCAFTLNLICPDTRVSFFEPSTGIVSDASEVHYVSDCHYVASYETAFACPYNCITKVQENGHQTSDKTFAVCGGRGMC